MNCDGTTIPLEKADLTNIPCFTIKQVCNTERTQAFGEYALLLNKQSSE